MPKNSLDDFIEKAAALTAPPGRTPEQEKRYAELRGRRTKELKLWEQWHTGGRKPEDLHPLLQSLDPFIRSETTKRLGGLGGSIPRAALHNELRNATARGIHSYDPTRGVQLQTHLTTNFQRITDFVAANRNEKYMPREDVESYQQYNNAISEFKEEHGREPTLAETQLRLPGWTAKKLKKMGRGFGPEVYTDMGVEFASDENRMHPHDALQLVRNKLKPEEYSFAQLHFPQEGPGMGIKQIAKELKVTPAKAYRIKSRVEALVGGILKQE